MGRQRKWSRVDRLQWLRRSLRRLWRWRLGRSVRKLSRLGKSRRWRRLGRRRSQLRRRRPQIGPEKFFAPRPRLIRSRKLSRQTMKDNVWEDGNVAREGREFAVFGGSCTPRNGDFVRLMQQIREARCYPGNPEDICVCG